MLSDRQFKALLVVSAVLSAGLAWILHRYKFPGVAIVATWLLLLLPSYTWTALLLAPMFRLQEWVVHAIALSVPLLFSFWLWS